jgi:F-type H+-transporting ATPase subunit epsilon
MARQINLTVVTPERMVVNDAVDDVTIPGQTGELGVLPEHTFLLSILKTGVLTYHRGGERHLVAISEGYVEVTPERVTVLAKEAERPEEIDLERARQSRDLALKDLRAGQEEVDFTRAIAKLEKAAVRMQVVTKGEESGRE